MVVMVSPSPSLPPTIEPGCVVVVGVAWPAWFHSIDCSITIVLCHVYVNTELSCSHIHVYESYIISLVKGHSFLAAH